MRTKRIALHPATGAQATMAGGTAVPTGTYPFVVALIGYGIHSARCGGTLVAQGWVLTAAHCQSGRVIAHRTDLSKWFHIEEIHRDIYNVERRCVFPGFEEETLRNDLALLKLDRSSRSDSIVDLARSTRWETFQPPLTIVGWGRDQHGMFPPKLQAGTVRWQELLPCSSKYAASGNHFAFDDLTFCTRPDPADADEGDSGGPVLIDQPDGPQQVGVISLARGHTLPDRHIKLTREFLAWKDAILKGDKATIAKSCNDG